MDLWTGACLKTFTGHSGPIYSLAFDGTNIITAGLDTKIRV